MEEYEDEFADDFERLNVECEYFVCPYCSEGDMVEDELMYHVMTEHSSVKRPVLCPLCAGEDDQVPVHLPSHLQEVHMSSDVDKTLEGIGMDRDCENSRISVDTILSTLMGGHSLDDLRSAMRKQGITLPPIFDSRPDDEHSPYGYSGSRGGVRLPSEALGLRNEWEDYYDEEDEEEDSLEESEGDEDDEEDSEVGEEEGFEDEDEDDEEAIVKNDRYDTVDSPHYDFDDESSPNDDEQQGEHDASKPDIDSIFKMNNSFAEMASSLRERLQLHRRVQREEKKLQKGTTPASSNTVDDATVINDDEDDIAERSDIDIDELESGEWFASEKSVSSIPTTTKTVTTTTVKKKPGHLDTGSSSSSSVASVDSKPSSPSSPSTPPDNRCMFVTSILASAFFESGGDRGGGETIYVKDSFEYPEYNFSTERDIECISRD